MVINEGIFNVFICKSHNIFLKYCNASHAPFYSSFSFKWSCDRPDTGAEGCGADRAPPASACRATQHLQRQWDSLSVSLHVRSMCCRCVFNPSSTVSHISGSVRPLCHWISCSGALMQTHAWPCAESSSNFGLLN